MTDDQLTKAMAPIRDEIARRSALLDKATRKLDAAIEAQEDQFTATAEGEVEAARRLLGEMPTATSWITSNGDRVGYADSPTPEEIDRTTGVLPCGSRTQSTTSPSPTAGTGCGCPSSDARQTHSEEIDRTLPPGFEVREFPQGWYPCKDIDGRWCRVFLFNVERIRWSDRGTGWYGEYGYPTEAAAYADKARWLKAAGVEWPPTTPEPAADPDEPQVVGGLELRPWSIRTKTHWWGPVSKSWIPLRGHVFVTGEYTSAFAANQHLSAARAAWEEMKKNKEAAR